MNQPQANPLIDAANEMLSPTPCNIITGTVSIPGRGNMMVATIRTPSTTLTLLLEKAEAVAWGKTWLETATGMSANGLITGNGHVS